MSDLSLSTQFVPFKTLYLLAIKKKINVLLVDELSFLYFSSSKSYRKYPY